MDIIVSVIAMIALVGVLSTLAGRLLTRKKGAFWVWDHSNTIGWALVLVGGALLLYGFLVDQRGTAMSVKLGFGSLLMIGGLGIIWFR